MYTYVTPEIAQAMADDTGDPDEKEWCLSLVGWWDAVKGVGEDGARADEVQIDQATAFLSLFKSGEDIKFTFAGEAPNATWAYETKGLKQPFFGNYVPRRVQFKEIVAANSIPDDDIIQVINPTTLGADAMYTYVTPEIAQAMADDTDDPDEKEWCLGLVGWWDAVKGVGEDDARVDELFIEPNAAFLGLLKSGENIQFNFPPSVKAEE